jgi:fructose/tagatose bisphosphate aldolase
MKIKFFIGPMSKNIVDAVIEFQKSTKHKLGLIPSRRQIEFNGGYCNNWTTKQFSIYAKDVLLKRDHSGPGQGYSDDDGYESLKFDSQYMDIIHIDPWKKYSSYKKGLNWTIEMIKFCNNINPKIKFEVGTEQSIRPFDPSELDKLVKDLKQNLKQSEFNQIKYLVIQSGTSLSSTYNTGLYDQEKLISMIRIAKKHNLISKEHNGDYISEKLIKEKMKLGLDSINIAPEFGLIETQTYLDEINNSQILNRLWEICYESKRWEKWVNKNFNPLKEKVQLIKICGHYVLSHKEFKNEIKTHFPNIDNKIKINIKNKLNSLCNL